MHEWVPHVSLLRHKAPTKSVIGSALYQTGEVSLRPREIIAYTATHGFPALLGALQLGAIFAKVILTANNYLFSPAAIAQCDAIFPALLASLICLFVVSWLTPPPQREKVAQFL